MEVIKNFEAKKASMETALPAGGYIAKILDAKEETFDWGKRLSIAFDIEEGQYKGFFKQLFDNSTNENVKWKGVYRLTVPQESNQWFESQKRTFSNAIWAIEESNPNYHWDWNEAGLKGKKVGVLFRNKEYEFEGSQGTVHGWTTECCMLTDIHSIDEGNFKIPKDKPLPQKEDAVVPPVQTGAGFFPIDDAGDIPF